MNEAQMLWYAYSAMRLEAPKPVKPFLGWPKKVEVSMFKTDLARKEIDRFEARFTVKAYSFMDEFLEQYKKERARS